MQHLREPCACRNTQKMMDFQAAVFHLTLKHHSFLLLQAFFYQIVFFSASVFPEDEKRPFCLAAPPPRKLSVRDSYEFSLPFSQPHKYEKEDEKKTNKELWRALFYFNCFCLFSRFFIAVCCCSCFARRFNAKKLFLV